MVDDGVTCVVCHTLANAPEERRGMEPDFPKENFGLNPIEVSVIGGLIYVCLSTPAPDDIETVRRM